MAKWEYLHSGDFYGSLSASEGVYDGVDRVYSPVNPPSLSAISGLLPISQISATGSPSSTTYLRGDGTWAAAGGSVSTSGAVNYKQSGTFGITAGVSGTSVVTLSPAMDVPYLVQFLDTTDNNGVYQNFSISNYTTNGFTVFWNSSPTNKTITWFAFDGSYNPGGVYKNGRRTTSAISINMNDYVITYTGSVNLTQSLFPATGSNRELVFTNDSNNLDVVYTITTSAGTIGGDSFVDLYDKESITVFDAATNIWEIH